MPIPRYTDTRWPALFSMGFRPFFFLAGLWALIAMTAWLALLWRGIFVPTAMGPLAWHAHEMLFGFVTAAIAGFVLTAVPNWTGRLPLQGAPLAGLVALWLAGRAAVACSAVVGPVIAALTDVSFLAVLLAVVAREVVAGRNWRNLPVAVALLLLLAANALSHGAAFGAHALDSFGHRLAIAVTIMLISLIGGRVVPSFTGNWLRKAGETRLPVPFGGFDKAVLALSALTLAGWVVVPDARGVAFALIAIGALHGVRLARWGGARTGAEPLVWVLHLGYGWLVAGLILAGLGPLLPALGEGAALHALTAGAMGTMILAVMSRATLGHSARPLTADAVTVAVYLLVSLAALLRLLSGIVPAFATELIVAGGLAWIGAFGLFVLRYAPLHFGLGRARAGA